MTTTAPNNDNDTLEQVFEMIQQGNQKRSEGNFWDAAESFLQASNLLLNLARGHSTLSKTTTEEEEEKIVRLYQQQCHEYFHQCRESLLEAMQQEHQNDVQQYQEKGPIHSPSDTTSYNLEHYQFQSLPEDQARQRVELFAKSFAAGAAVTTSATSQTPHEEVEDDATNVLQKQMSLEERLMELNANLPTGLKTDTQRLRDLNSGLRRLGVPDYSSSTSHSFNKVEPPKSAADQVAEIIAQAKEEVALEAHHSSFAALDNQPSTIDDKNDNSDIDDESDVDSDDGADSLLSDDVPQLQNVSQIRDQVAAAQAKLAELVALLDTLPTVDEQEEADVVQPSNNVAPTVDPAPGKHMIQEARQSLHQALKLWKIKAVVN